MRTLSVNIFTYLCNYKCKDVKGIVFILCMFCFDLPVSAMSDFDVLMLRTSTANSCGEPFSQEQFLPLGCGEAVFNFSLEKSVYPDGSGDEPEWEDTTEDYIYRTVTTFRPRDIGPSSFTTRSLLSTSVLRTRPTTRSTTHPRIDMMRVTLDQNAPRVPPPLTASPESRQSSFHFLLRLHMNRFNKRLSMLESNTLDMKDSLQYMRGQQSNLSSQLERLLALQSAVDKTERMGELEKGYNDMEARLSRLEGRLEILIDGFTALAQEMEKLRRGRHVARSPQERRALPELSISLGATVYTTSWPAGRTSPTERPQTRATVPKSLPTPQVPANTAKASHQAPRKQKPTVTTSTVRHTLKPKPLTTKPKPLTTKPKPSTRSTKGHVIVSLISKQKTTRSKNRTNSKPKITAMPKPEMIVDKKKPATTAKSLSKTSPGKSRQTKNAATTKYQLSPPSHKSRPSTEVVKGLPSSKLGTHATKKVPQPKSKGKKDSSFRADAPDSKKIPTHVKTTERTAKKQPNPKVLKPMHPSTKVKGQPQSRTPAPTVYQLVPPFHKVNTASKPKVQTMKKGPSSTSTLPTKITASKTKSKTTAKYMTTTTKKPEQRNKPRAQSDSVVSDIVKLLRGHQPSKKMKRKPDGGLHIVLGRMAIPIKIIPDY